MMLARRIAALLVLASGSLSAAEVKSFGKPLEGLPLASLSEVLAKPEAGKLVRLQGTIEKVCQNKGCWLTVKQGSQAVHVTFEGYSFFVPKDASGRAVVLEGKVKVKQPDAGEVSHLKGEGAGEPAAARVSVEARGVEIRDE